LMSCTTILPDTEVGVFRLYQPSTYDKFYTRVYGETESRISLDVMLDVEIEHHIISISLTPRAISWYCTWYLVPRWYMSHQCTYGMY